MDDEGPSGPGRGTQEAATIDYGDTARLGIDDKPFGYTIARKGDDVTRIEREHLLVALEPGAGTKPTIERIGQLLHLAALGPARGEARRRGLSSVDRGGCRRERQGRGGETTASSIYCKLFSNCQ